MSVEVLPHTIIHGAELPSYSDAYNQSKSVSNWVNEYIPYDQRLGEYKLDRAIEHSRAICFAQAVGSVAISRQVFGMPAGIMLTNSPSSHALAFGLVKEPSSPIDEVIFYEPGLTREGAMHRDAFEQSIAITDTELGNLVELFSRSLSEKLRQNTKFCYYGVQDYNLPSQWRIYESDSIRNNDFIPQELGAFILIDSDRGEAMLNAIGDMHRYRANKPSKYLETFEHLLPLVPDFVDVLDPSLVSI